MHAGAYRSQRAQDPGTGNTGCFELTDLCAGNQVRVLYKSSKRSYLLNHLSSFCGCVYDSVPLEAVQIMSCRTRLKD